MPKSLLIVESPAKARTIKKYVGADFSVKASIGHIKDLPPNKLGVDVKRDFSPTYEIIKGKKKIIKEIVDAAGKVETVYLALDPDREGEAIAWHIAEEIRNPKSEIRNIPDIYRVLFHEITSKAVKEAIAHPGKLDSNLYEAQQARRILDRLVGYQISPILWEKVRRGLSAGRVQSVAVRIVCERESQIAAFKTEEYWSIVAKLEGGIPPPFEAKLVAVDGKKIEIKNEIEADKILSLLKDANFVLAKITRQEKRRWPSPPFITSKLQQEAARKLRFSPKRTMMIAQDLYEGVDLGDGERVGLITYMRTDSVRVSDAAIQEARSFIGDKFGDLALPEKPNFYRNKRGAQDAHEAIRPTSMKYTPDYVSGYLDKDYAALYELIWKRFVASQMKPAVFDQTTFDITANPPISPFTKGEQGGIIYFFRATGSVLKFPGFIACYLEGMDEETKKDEEENPTLPELAEGEILKLLGLIPNQHFTEPPPRFTEASLIKELETQGIGRPSTYAAILSTIQDKEYVEKITGRLRPTELGKLVNDLLVNHFPVVMDIKFTAQMEDELDEVEEGKRKWTAALNDFYEPFEKTVKKARGEMKNIKMEMIATDLTCEKCSSPMVIRWGRHGQFLSCSNYPKCKTAKEFERGEGGEIKVVEEEKTDEVCEKCGSPMVVKRGRFGKFLACSKYPECKGTKSISLGVKCPKCGGDVVERRTRRGRAFYGCSSYPKCDFTTWNRPVNEPCPNCASPFLVEKVSRGGGVQVVCPKKECGYKR